jgi:sugar (pentulose or hexulose) kinase
MDRAGKILRIVSRAYPIAFPRPGWSEQNPEDWLRETITGIIELTEGFDKSQIAGIGAGGQMHGLVVLDKEDRVLRPAILWNDGRTAEETDYLNNVIGKQTLLGCTANIAFAGFTAPKLLWMKKIEPDLFARIDKIMLPKDYINYKLSGVHCTDYSDASGMLLLDVEHKCWSKHMLDVCCIKESMMPRLYESYEVVGTLLPDMAAELGLLPSVKIAAGAGDNAAAAVGTATVTGGTAADGAGVSRCNISIGTSGTIFITSDKFGTMSASPDLTVVNWSENAVNTRGAVQPQAVPFKPTRFEDAVEIAEQIREKRTVILNLERTDKDIARRILDFLCGIAYLQEGKLKKIAVDTYLITPDNTDQRGALHVFAHADGGYHLMGVMLSAASCNKWWMEDILKTSQYADEQLPITRDKLGCNHVYFLPYLMGERSPHNDPAARGAFIGLSMDNSRADMMQAVLEGVAFGIRDSLEAARSLGIDIQRSNICGGGAKSPLWKEIIANVLNLELDCMESEEGPGYGGAILAAVACGEFSSVREAAEQLVKVASVVKPEAEIAARYEECYQVFHKIYPALKPLFQIL